MFTLTLCVKYKNEHDEAEKHGIRFLGPGEDAAESLQPPEQSFNLITLVHFPIVFPTMNPGLEWRNHGPEPQIRCRLAGPVPSFARSINRDGFPCRPPNDGAVRVPRAHHGPVPGTAGTSPSFGHPRQPDESRYPIPRGTCRQPADCFSFAHRFRRDGPSRWYCPSTSLPADPNELFLPDMLENPVGNPALRPTVRPGVDGMPTPEPGRQSPPLAAMPGNVRDGIGCLQVRDAHIPPLHPHKRHNVLVLLFSRLHLEPPSISYTNDIITS